MNLYDIGGRWIPEVAPLSTAYPCAIFAHDNWDDYGYKTSYHMAIFTSPYNKALQSEVKILQQDPADPGEALKYTTLPTGVVDQLPESYCSLGLSLEYYSKLKNLGEALYDPYLKSVRDVAYNPEIGAKFESMEGFRVSLLRGSESEKAYREAQSLFRETTFERILQFSFSCLVPGAAEPHRADMDFGEHPTGLNRTVVLIGKNGTGKTRFLAEFAHAMSGKRLQRREGLGFAPKRPSFSRVIAISYSVFDDFDRPSEQSRQFSYKYLGVRAPNEIADEGGNDVFDDTTANVLLTQSQLRERLVAAAASIEEQERSLLWRETVEILLEGRITPDDPRFADMSFYEDLSSGQRILLSLMTQALAHIAPESIILFDEPELHLHPEVFAALIRALDKILHEFNSYAIIATHSPLLLQETLGRQVRVFGRIGNVPLVTPLPVESFGENLSAIIHEVFSVDGSEHNFRAHLNLLRANHTADEIDRMFPRGPPLLARSYLYSEEPPG